MLNEIIHVGQGKRTNQICILAGGAASGKSTAINKFIRSEDYRIYNVDDLKELVVNINSSEHSKYPQFSKNNMDWKDPDQVSNLHYHIKGKGHDLAMRNNLFRAKNQPKNPPLPQPEHDVHGNKTTSPVREYLPNLMFDITMKDISELIEILVLAKKGGYKPTDIHIVWVLTDFEVAKMLNTQRKRVVRADIHKNTHIGAANTMITILKQKHLDRVPPTVFDGDIFVFVNNDKHEKVLREPNPTRDDLAGSIGIKPDKTEPTHKYIQQRPGKMKAVYTAFKVKSSGKPIKINEKDEITLNNLIKQMTPATDSLMESQLPSEQLSIYVDMDGTLVDFVKGAADVIGYDPNSKHDSEWWGTLEQHPDFYGSLEWLPGAKKMLGYIKSHFDSHILTGCPRKFKDKAAKQKHNWLQREGFGDIDFIATFSKEKHKYAKPNHVLIDDREDMIDDWTRAGGIGILFKNPRQALEQLYIISKNHK